MGKKSLKGPEEEKGCKLLYSDGSGEIGRSSIMMSMRHDTAVAHKPQTNGVAEAAVKRAKEGTSCALDQSGFTSAWWVQALICFCFF